MSCKYKVYVINLDRSTDRLTLITQTFEKLGLEFERVNAVDGSQLEAKDYTAANQFHRPLQANEIACYLSHVKCWNKILTDNVDFGVVLEDDIALIDDFQHVIEQLIEHCHNHSLGFVKLSANKLHRKHQKYLSTIDNTHKLVKLSPVPVIAKGQLISREVSQLLVNTCATPTMPIDVVFREEWRFPFKVLNILPTVFAPTSTHFKSTIGNRKTSNGYSRNSKWRWTLKFHVKLYTYYAKQWIKQGKKGGKRTIFPQLSIGLNRGAGRC